MFWWIMVASVSSSSGGRQAVASRSSTCFKDACIRTNFSYPYFRGIYCVFRSFLPPQTLRSFCFRQRTKMQLAGRREIITPKRKFYPVFHATFSVFLSPFHFSPRTPTPTIIFISPLSYLDMIRFRKLFEAKELLE